MDFKNKIEKRTQALCSRCEKVKGEKGGCDSNRQEKGLEGGD